MITISVNENLVIFSENGATIKEIKKTSRNAQFCFVKKMGISNFDWKTDWDMKLKNASEKYINSTSAISKAVKDANKARKEEKVETPIEFKVSEPEQEAEVDSSEVDSSEVKVTSEGAEVEEAKAVVNGHVQTERTYVNDEGDVITVVA